MERATLLLAIIPFLYTCYACGAGSASEYQYIQNPTMTFNISPPISWTYFPTTSPDSQTIWYFVGQSNTSVQASQLASAQIQAAMTQALVEANLPVSGVNISSNYVPVSVLNPSTLTTGAGPLYGKVEANALTQVAAGGTGVTAFTWQPYSQVVTVTLQPIGTIMYNWIIVKNAFMEQLMLNFYAKFTTDITITGQNTNG